MTVISSSEALDPSLPCRLLLWFDRCKRILPWRENRDPYRVWLSEIMLQQTRVSAVIEYFQKFTAAYPTVRNLAEADEEDVMKLWAGLGYYRRMRLLLECAKTVVREHNGTFPDQSSELLKLPGIGKYTAGAIASIAFDEPSPAVDGNVLRVLSRLTESNSWNADKAEMALVPLYPRGRCGDFAQSLMELGAIVCLPNGEPLCGECPIRELCRAHASGTEMQYPAKEKKKPRQIDHLNVFLLRSQDKIAVRKRPDTGLLSGLWELPNTPASEPCSPGKYGILVRKSKAKHIFTHREWHMTVYEMICKKMHPEFTWLPETECPLPSAFRKLLKP